MKINDMASPSIEYEKNIKMYNSNVALLDKTINTISRLRLFISVTGSLLVILSIEYNYYVPAALITLFALSAFVYYVSKHEDARNKKLFFLNLISINNNSIARINGTWHSFEKSGDCFKNDKHPFSGDLDIFGHGSLFQLISTPNTHGGIQNLKEFLIHPDKKIQAIIQRQTATDELSKKLNFRQKLQAICLDDPYLLKDPSEIIDWVGQDVVLLKKRFQILLIRTLPVITIIFISLSVITSGIFFIFILPLFIIQMMLLTIWKKEVNIVFPITNRHKESIKQYYSLIKHIEKESFFCEYLQNLQSDLTGKNRLPASKIIKKLDDIVDYMNMRYSSLHFIINAITLWDLHCLIAIEKWKLKSGINLHIWYQSIAEFEALSSLAILKYDNPDWIFPAFTEDMLVFTAEKAGHPLIQSDIRVCNDFTIQNSGSFGVITGSNMSGKSTMLRTIGLNLVLAYSGAPVCADSMNCSVMDICTSMRITDNLEEKVSTFYAELLKIKMIIETAKTNKPVIVLLDEILRGTNTRDRRIGVEAVLKNLSSYNLLGIISTHDLEVADLAGDEQFKIKNYHFKEDYHDDQIFFDYKIHSGSYDGSDAIYLMRMIGIQL